MKTANYINLKKLYEIQYNALEHNDMSEQLQKVEKAINLLSEIKKEAFCECNKPERAKEKENLLDRLVAEYKQDRKKHPIKWMLKDFKWWVLTSINWIRIKLSKK